MDTWGRNFRLTIFGESHGPAIGVVIDGLPPGFAPDMDEVAREMGRRAPGGELSTARKEADAPEILSGFFNGKTTGAALCAIIRNSDARSGDYTPEILRPGHADLTAMYKYGGFADYRGGGHFSGRLTAPLVFAGALAKQFLRQKGIWVASRIRQIYDVEDREVPFGEAEAAFRAAAARPFPVVDDGAGERMKAAILAAKAEGDSVGGVVECAVFGLPAGLGEPFFESAESVISSMVFSIPAVKGISFGAGFGLSRMRGSRANDPLYYDGTSIRSRTNNNGGINGGIANGNPLIFQAAFKPTPSIAIEQETVDTAKGQTVMARTRGRHDPCVVPRAAPVVEAAAAVCVMELETRN
ncbi:MAG: chorismate synthase [Defluviitaleaceae bacterium]|nr:chorismate synthase [Defluviitaleaceae bacterium]